MTPTANPKSSPDPNQVLARALFNAGKLLGLSKKTLGDIVGRDRSSIERGGIDPHSKTGELALLLIRCYRSLYALTGGDPETMKHWMRTENRYFEARPVDQVMSVTGLMAVVEYLDAMRGRA